MQIVGDKAGIIDQLVCERIQEVIDELFVRVVERLERSCKLEAYLMAHNS